MQKNAFLIIAIIILVVLGGFYLFSSREQQTACTLEAKICPDGSSVSRVAPNCDFAPCPGEKEGILVSSPKRNETIKSPLIIEGEANATTMLIYYGKTYILPILHASLSEEEYTYFDSLFQSIIGVAEFAKTS